MCFCVTLFTTPDLGKGGETDVSIQLDVARMDLDPEWEIPQLNFIFCSPHINTYTMLYGSIQNIPSYTYIFAPLITPIVMVSCLFIVLTSVGGVRVRLYLPLSLPLFPLTCSRLTTDTKFNVLLHRKCVYGVDILMFIQLSR